MFELYRSQASGAPRFAAAPARALASKPPVERLRIEGHVICDYGDMDRAGDWLRCRRGPTCPNGAYMATVYPSEAAAEGHIDRRGRSTSERVLGSRPSALTRPEPLRFHIRHLLAEGFLGRDYRAMPCGLRDATRDLRQGHGEEPAWLEIQRQRDEEDVEGALLPGGPDATGTLFLFVSAADRIQALELIKTISWSENP